MVVIQSIFRVMNCKELQPVVQLSQLMINSVNDVEWHPTYYQVEPVSDDVNTDTEEFLLFQYPVKNLSHHYPPYLKSIHSLVQTAAVLW